MEDVLDMIRNEETNAAKKKGQGYLMRTLLENHTIKSLPDSKLMLKHMTMII